MWYFRDLQKPEFEICVAECHLLLDVNYRNVRWMQMRVGSNCVTYFLCRCSGCWNIISFSKYVVIYSCLLITFHNNTFCVYIWRFLLILWIVWQMCFETFSWALWRAVIHRVSATGKGFHMVTVGDGLNCYTVSGYWSKV